MLPKNLLQLERDGFCVLPGRLPIGALEACRRAFWPLLLEHLAQAAPNRGPGRHFLPMPFAPPCFAPEFFFDPEVLSLIRAVLGDRVVADQWGCDVPVAGSAYQDWHIDFRRPLFEEAPALPLPAYMLLMSFGLTPIGPDDGPIQIAPGTHRLHSLEALEQAAAALCTSTPGASPIPFQPVELNLGDVLIRHPWALHRGTPNLSLTPRALLTIRFVRRWYADDSREVHCIPAELWSSLTPNQRALLRFPVHP